MKQTFVVHAGSLVKINCGSIKPAVAEGPRYEMNLATLHDEEGGVMVTEGMRGVPGKGFSDGSIYEPRIGAGYAWYGCGDPGGGWEGQPEATVAIEIADEVFVTCHEGSGASAFERGDSELNIRTADQDIRLIEVAYLLGPSAGEDQRQQYYNVSERGKRMMIEAERLRNLAEILEDLGG